MAGARSQMTDWNPMSEAHNDPHFNSYNDGPGKHFQTSGGAASNNSKLYVKNLPLEMTEDGLRNVFTNAAGATPVRVSIPTAKPQFTKNHGFVNFNSSSEATKALMNLNKKQPLFLEISYQKPKSETRPPTRQLDTLTQRGDTSPRSQCPPPNPSGVIDWEGVRRAGYLDGSEQQRDRAWADPKDAFVEPRRAGFYDPRGGASGMAEIAPANNFGVAVNFNISASADGRRVSYGRGYFPPAPSIHRIPKKSKSKRNKSASGPINSLLGPHPLLSAAIPKDPQVTTHVNKTLSLPAPSVQTLLSAVAKPCNLCYQPATLVCWLCKKTRYCNRECADKHWVAHKHSCVLDSDPPGVMLFTDVQEPISAPTKPDVALAAPSSAILTASVPAKPVLPTTKAREDHVPQASALGIENYEDMPLGKYMTVTVGGSDGSTGWVSLDARSDYSYEMMTAITARKDLAAVADPCVGDYVAANFHGDWLRACVTKTTPLSVFFFDYGNTEEVLLDQILSLPAEYLKEPGQAVRICVLPSASGARRSLEPFQSLSVCAVRKVGDVTYVKLLPDDQDEAPKPATVEATKPKTVPTAKLLSATLPSGVLSAVTVVGSASNGGVWVNLVASASALTDLLTRLQNTVAAMPVATNITVGSLVVVTHLRTTYRAQVTSVGPAGLTVRLVDEGRDIVVDAQKVRSLPAEFLGLEAQAIEIHTKEDSLLSLSTLLEGAEIIVQPVGKNPSGATIVEVPGKPHVELACHQRLQPLSIDQATKVYFVSKENEEFYVQPTTSSQLLGNMLKEFEVLDSASALKPCGKAVVGQVVVAKFEGDWSRCKILSVDNNIEVIFIDYGNKSIVAKEELRELPEKYTHIPGQCVKVHFTKETPTAVMQLPEFQVFFATLFAEASNGSLVVRGKLVE